MAYPYADEKYQPISAESQKDQQVCHQHPDGETADVRGPIDARHDGNQDHGDDRPDKISQTLQAIVVHDQQQISAKEPRDRS